MTPSSAENDSSSSGLGIGGILVSGIVFALGFIVLIDTAWNMLALYEGSVHAPGEIWLRVVITSVLGSTCLLASLSNVFHRS